MRETVGVLLPIMLLPFQKGLAPIDWFKVLLTIYFYDSWRALYIWKIEIKTKQASF
jgi:hypothetical protein